MPTKGRIVGIPVLIQRRRYHPSVTHDPDEDVSFDPMVGEGTSRQFVDVEDEAREDPDGNAETETP